jgi:glycolate oxidase FAD binding subunit
MAAAFNPGQVRHGRDHDAVDGMVPSMAITVRSAEDVRRVVAEAASADAKLIACGTGSMLELGNRPQAFDLRLTTAGMASRIEAHPEDMTVTVEAGVGLARLNRDLAEAGQRLAIDAAPARQATVGGLIATDTTGGYAHGFGRPRDLVLGLTVVDGRGRLLRTGGRVVKNVAGYDLPRLFSGSFGTLGVITQATLRTHPLPRVGRTLCFALSDPAHLEAARRAIFASELPLCAFDFEAAERARWTLAVRIEGNEEQTSYQAARLAELCNQAPDEVGEEWTSPIHAAPEDNVVMRIGAPPVRAVRVAGELLGVATSKAAGARVCGRLGDGLLRLHARCERSRNALELVQAVRDTEFGRAAVVERVPTPVKSHIDVWGPQPASMSLMRSIKAVFDPRSLFAPGRFVGGL